MSKTAERTNPELWEAVKDEVKRGNTGGEAGEWSARKAQLAVREYKKRGGGYRGKASASENQPKQWAEGDWAATSGRPNGETSERYIPQEMPREAPHEARDTLADEDYRATSEKQREESEKGKPFSKSPREIVVKTLRLRHATMAGTVRLRTKAEMLREAKQLEIGGRSRMDKEELAKAIRFAKH